MDIPSFQKFILKRMYNSYGYNQAHWEWILILETPLNFNRLYFGYDVKTHIMENTGRFVCGESIAEPINVLGEMVIIPSHLSKAPNMGKISFCKFCICNKK